MSVEPFDNTIIVDERVNSCIEVKVKNLEEQDLNIKVVISEDVNDFVFLVTPLTSLRSLQRQTLTFCNGKVRLNESREALVLFFVNDSNVSSAEFTVFLQSLTSNEVNVFQLVLEVLNMQVSEFGLEGVDWTVGWSLVYALAIIILFLTILKLAKG